MLKKKRHDNEKYKVHDITTKHLKEKDINITVGTAVNLPGDTLVIDNPVYSVSYILTIVIIIILACYRVPNDAITVCGNTVILLLFLFLMCQCIHAYITTINIFVFLYNCYNYSTAHYPWIVFFAYIQVDSTIAVYIHA